MNWHQLDTETVLNQTGSSPEGLSTAAAKDRLLHYGPNELAAKKKKPAWLLLLGQFKDFMILILIAAAIVAGIAGDLTDTIIILLIVLVNAVFGFVQEYHAEKAIEALQKIAALQTQALRDGQPQMLPAAQLVPGDIVLLEAGNNIPADLRLLECYGLRVNESALTGESVPVEKITSPLAEAELQPGDQLNMCFKNTLVTNGRARAVVIATGMQTQIGRIATLLEQAAAVTPLQKRMADFGRKLSYLILFICLLLFVIGLLRGEEPLRMLLISISLAVAAIPEALPALITIALSRGAKRMVGKNALVRKLPAVETLGSVTFICTDKTGTLTQNKMKVVKEYAAPVSMPGLPDFSMLDAGLLLNHDVKENNEGLLLGDPTELALAEHFAVKHSAAKMKELRLTWPREAELPFDADRKCMTTVHRHENGYLVVSKGAVEAIVSTLQPGDAANASVLAMADTWAREGIRVIAYAYKFTPQLPEPFQYEIVEAGLQFAGLAGMIDPPREEVKKAIAECKTAGIHTVMITGDHPSTAAAIAREIGILSPHDLVITGKELKAMAREEFEEKAEQIRVYARVSPEQKLQIVKTLQHRNHFVAMTGDGVNDAPSLKAANIGVAMGITGTDVSKEAAHMILLDDNFATIVKAVKEGRRIYDNIRKFVKYIMTCNGAELWTMFLAPFIGLPVPLLPIHILWINMVTDGLPGLALATERSEKDIMKRLPRRTNESLFAGGIGYHILWVGLLMAGVTLGVQAWAVQQEKEHWQTMVFTVLSLSQLGHVMAIRSEREYLYRQGFFSNPLLIGAVLLTFLLQMAVIYLPFANTVLKTQPLTLQELLICIALSAVVFQAVELEKFFRYKWKRKVDTAKAVA